MSRILCVAVVLSASLVTGAGPAFAGMSEGVAAVTVGDYEKAISEFQPLAAAGDPAAQYQLAKIYLEGRGPADGVPQGIALMTKAANGGYPEAQAQLGLMYAMGLGVEVDNAQAYDWLTRAVKALPAGTRRAVAEANRDTVLKRMSAAEKAVAAAKPAPTESTVATTSAKPAAAQEAAKKPAAETTAAKTATAKTATAKTATAKTATAKTATAASGTSAPVTTTTKTVTEAAATNKTATNKTTTNKTTTNQTATNQTATTVAKATSATTAKAATNAAATNAAATTASKTAANTAKPAAAEAETPEKSNQAKSTQVASAKAPDAAPKAEAQKAAASGVRIQLVSMPSEQAAWSAWKQLSGKYASQLSGLTAMVEPADLGDKGTFYRVQTGPFQTVAAAQERCTAMKEAGLDCLVVGKP